VNAGNGAWQKSHRPAGRDRWWSRFGGKAGTGSDIAGSSGCSITVTSTVIDIVNTGATGAHPCCVTF
jgi:hypothetical protein